MAVASNYAGCPMHLVGLPFICLQLDMDTWKMQSRVKATISSVKTDQRINVYIQSSYGTTARQNRISCYGFGLM